VACHPAQIRRTLARIAVRYLGAERGEAYAQAAAAEALLARHLESNVLGDDFTENTFTIERVHHLALLDLGLINRLVDAGNRVRVYVPFGTQWYGYFVRRIAERPANLTFFLRALAERRH
jgi:proline dehydrogenase